MSYAEIILPEFEQETGNTRKVLERVPEDKLDWKAHPRSNTIGWNAIHLSEIPGWIEPTITLSSLDIAPAGKPPYQAPKLTRRKEILDHFDQNVAKARKALSAARDEEMAKPWSLLQTGKPLLTMPRAAVIRTLILNHMIHHRAILCVYLRLNNIPVPGMYGPSGDE